MYEQEIKQELNVLMTNSLFSGLGNTAKKNLSTTLLDKIIEMIMDETLKPGFVFPNENEMCRQLGIGRSTLRETYTALAAMGFITRTKAGTTVNDNRKIISSVPLKYIFKNSELDEIMEFRIMLEAQNAFLAARYADDQAIEEMEKILEDMKNNAGSDIDRLSKLDFNFHFSIAMATNNSLLKNTLAAVANELERSAYSGFYIDPETTIKNSVEFHEQVVAAIKAHDPQTAKRAMRAHIKNIYTVLRKVMLEVV